MDSVGRWADNIIIERWFRTLKHEHLYLMDYQTMKDPDQVSLSLFAITMTSVYILLGYLTPKMVYFNEN